MSHLQDILRLQMLQQRGSKNEEQENEDQDQPEDVQEEEQEESQKRLIGHYQQVQKPPNYGPFNGKMLNTNKAKSSRKSCYSMSSSSSHLTSEQAEINNARYGKFVKVQEGHIVRSTARKVRHSTVYTSKGPRDRRFRLSAPTAIQFYDVQDRLGYDQPSKAIDWLIEKSKAAIEALSESVPPGKEYGCTNDINNSAQQTEQDIGGESIYQFRHHQRSYGEPEKLNNVNSFQEPVLDPHQLSPMNYAEEALNSASSLSDSKVMEMGWFQSLMAWNYKAGDGGDGCPFSSSHVYLQ